MELQHPAHDVVIGWWHWDRHHSCNRGIELFEKGEHCVGAADLGRRPQTAGRRRRTAPAHFSFDHHLHPGAQRVRPQRRVTAGRSATDDQYIRLDGLSLHGVTICLGFFLMVTVAGFLPSADCGLRRGLDFCP